MIFIIDVEGGRVREDMRAFRRHYFTVDLDHPIAVDPFAGELTREKRRCSTTLMTSQG